MKSIKIANQEWSIDNLCVTHFRNGDPIQEVKNYDDWMNAYNSNNPARMSYRKSKKKGETYGFFYNWHTIIDKRGLAPIGYKIPSKNDWDELVNFLGEEKAGEKVKSDTLWKNSDETLFIALLQTSEPLKNSHATNSWSDAGKLIHVYSAGATVGGINKYCRSIRHLTTSMAMSAEWVEPIGRRQ